MSLSAADRQEVSDLLVRYVMAVDSAQDEQEFVELFTDDAELRGPGFYWSGTSGVREFAREVLKFRASVQIRHMLANILVEGDGELAVVRAYYTEYTTYAAPPKGVPRSELMYVGTYECRARKVGSTWRLQERKFQADTPLMGHEGRSK
jgi:3-phenylpropionate/cinnamic acid dioxygenase small subunit